MSMFNIGDTVYRATFDAQEEWVLCPECGNTKVIRCILFDGTEHIIPCVGCASGFDAPRGYVRKYERTPKAESMEVTGVSVNTKHGEQVVEYVLQGIYTHHVKQENVFATKDEAMAKAAQMAADFAEEERLRIYKKEKDTRTWSWNVHYHRGCIRRAEKDILYHTAKLNAALPKAKEDKATKSEATHD